MTIHNTTFTFTFFFFNDTATTEIYTLSLHDALPIWQVSVAGTFNRWDRDAAPLVRQGATGIWTTTVALPVGQQDRKSTRLNSSHSQISYAVFCLKKKN